MKKVVFLGLAVFCIVAFSSKEQRAYKCMIQMKNYAGEGAYISVSLLNPDGSYAKTLQVFGDDKEWYPEVDHWWAFQKKSNQKIDAITGATIGGGQRKILSIVLKEAVIDTGYKIRFETSVENNDYYKDDVEFELTSETVRSKTEGNGFIRYVRMMPK